MLNLEQYMHKRLKNIPFSLFQFKRNDRNFNIHRCSCSSSDSMRIENRQSITDDISGLYCNERSCWATNACFNISTMGSMPPECLKGDIQRENTVSNNSTPHI